MDVLTYEWALPSKDSLYWTMFGWLMLARTATSLRDSCLSLFDIWWDKECCMCIWRQIRKKCHLIKIIRFLITEICIKFIKRCLIEINELTLEMPISLITYCRPSVLDLTRMAFPKDPSPIFFNLSYLSMSVKIISHAEAKGNKIHKIRITSKTILGFL